MKKQYGNFILQVLEDRILIGTKEPMWETSILATSEMYYYLSQMVDDETMDEYVSNWILCSFLHCTNLLDNEYFEKMAENYTACIERLNSKLEPTDESEEQILADERKREALRQTVVLESEQESGTQE